MKFSSVGGCLSWYCIAREGSPRAPRLDPVASSPRRLSSSPGSTLAAVSEIGAALQVLVQIERVVLLLRHGRNLSIEEIRREVSHLTRRRYQRRVVEQTLSEAEEVLDEELRRRGLLGDDSEG